MDPTPQHRQPWLLLPVRVAGRSPPGFRPGYEAKARRVAFARKLLRGFLAEDALAPIPGKPAKLEELPGQTEPILRLGVRDAVGVVAWYEGVCGIPVGWLTDPEGGNRAVCRGLAAVAHADPARIVEAGFATPIDLPTGRVLRLRPQRLLRWAAAIQDQTPPDSRWFVPFERRLAVQTVLAAAMPNPVNTESALRRALQLAQAEVLAETDGRYTVPDLTLDELTDRLRGSLVGSIAATLLRRARNGRFYWRPERLKQAMRLSRKENWVLVRGRDEPPAEALATSRLVDAAQTALETAELVAAIEGIVDATLVIRRKDDRVTPVAKSYVMALLRAEIGVSAAPPPQKEYADAHRIDCGSLSVRVAKAWTELAANAALRRLLGAA